MPLRRRRPRRHGPVQEPFVTVEDRVPAVVVLHVAATGPPEGAGQDHVPGAQRVAHGGQLRLERLELLGDAVDLDPVVLFLVERLLAAGIPVIPISVMTLDELAPIAADLGLQRAMVIEAGGVVVNDVPGFRADNMPYGGVKDSGAGREGPRFAIEELTVTRMAIIRP